MITHLSYSAVSTFNQCPRMWWLGYIRGVKQPSTQAQMYGTAVHTIIEGLMVGEPIDAVTAVKKAIAKNGGRGTSTQNFLDIKETALDIESILNDPGVDSVLRGIKVETGNIERYVEFTIPGVPLPVVGYIDAIQVNGVPLDIKTSAFDWDEDRAANETQPMYYLRALYPNNPELDEFDHLVFVKSSLIPRAYLIRTHYPGFADKVDKLVRDAWGGMEQWLDPKISPPVCNNEKCWCRKVKI